MSKIYPKDFYLLSRALKLHFDEASNYDGLKYNFRLKDITSRQFEGVRGFHRCVALAKRCQNENTARRYITANILHGNVSIFSFNDELYTEWLARMQSISYHVSSQLKSITDNFDELFVGKDYPLIVEKFFEKKISIETITCINRITGFIDKIDIQDPLLWPSEKYKIRQYTPLFAMDVDLKKIKHQIVKSYE